MERTGIRVAVLSAPVTSDVTLLLSPLAIVVLATIGCVNGALFYDVCHMPVLSVCTGAQRAARLFRLFLLFFS